MMSYVSIERLLKEVENSKDGLRILGHRSKNLNNYFISTALYSKTVDEIREYLRLVKKEAEMHDIYFDIFELYLNNGMAVDVASEMNGEVE